MRRSLYLGIRAPQIAIDKYRHPQVTDLQQVLSFNGVLQWKTLDFFCKRLQLDVPEDEYTGADVGRLVAAGDWEAVRAHNLSDVGKTAKLAARLGLFTL